MRMMFGLVSLLVTLGVIVWIMHTFTLPAAQQAGQAKNLAEEKFGSNTPAGVQAQRDSADLVAATGAGGRFEGLLVKSVVAGGSLENYFGLRPGDVIVGVGGVDFAPPMDFEDAQAQLLEAKLRQQALTVRRAGATVELRPR